VIPYVDQSGPTPQGVPTCERAGLFLTRGIPECVDDGVSAFLVEDRSAEALADRLAHIATHPEDWGRWQRLGREWVAQHFDMDRIGQRLWDIYVELIDAEHSPEM